MSIVVSTHCSWLGRYHRDSIWPPHTLNAPWHTGRCRIGTDPRYSLSHRTSHITWDLCLADTVVCSDVRPDCIPTLTGYRLKSVGSATDTEVPQTRPQTLWSFMSGSGAEFWKVRKMNLRKEIVRKT